MSDGVHSHRLGPALLTALLAATPVQAQIVTDGTVGPKVSLSGGEIKIGADLGTRRGDNLFHSFEKFGIATGQTATFTGPGEIKNVISRVTGGEVSNIDGKLASTVGQADLYFLNPAGIMFGPNATLDVPGSFHVSTAHELRFTDGVSFSALDKTGSGLTVAPPEAFGFLDRPPSRIAVEHSQLQLAPGKAFSLVGGNIDIAGGSSGSISTTGGTVTLTSITGAGQSRLLDGANDAARGGAIQLTDQALIDTSGSGGGTVRIHGGVLVVDQANIRADNAGDSDATGGIDLQVGKADVNASLLTIDAFGTGRGGVLKVEAGELSIRNGAFLASNTYGLGQAGTVAVRAGRLFVSRDGAEQVTGILSGAIEGTGAAGSIQVTAGDLQLRNGGEISNATFTDGNAGTVAVGANTLLISGDGSPYFTGIASQAVPESAGAAGNVQVTAGDLQLRDGGEISSNTFARGNAGTVAVGANTLLISGDGAPYFTGISSDTIEGTGTAGSIQVTAGDLQLRDGGSISSGTLAQGNAGTVAVQADYLLISRDGSPYPTGIVTRAESNSTGTAGSIQVTAGDLQLRDGGSISSGTLAQGNAGTVQVRADRLLISGNSLPELTGISSDAYRSSSGAAGNVQVAAGDLQLRDGGKISSDTFTSGNAGTVQVRADQLLISGASTGISSLTGANSSGAGGAVTVSARTMQVRDGGTVSTQSNGSGVGGPITINVTDKLDLDHAAIQSQTAIANGGDIRLAAGRLFDLRNSTVTTSVAAGRGSGGNIFINPYLMVLDNSRIEADAKQGAGGNITIQAGQLIRSPDSVIRASSELGLSGAITIAAPNTDVAGSLVILPETFFDVSSQLRETCAARGGRPASSFSAGGRGGMPPDPGAPLTANSLEQPLGQQTATGSPKTLAAKPRRAVKPITVAGIPQPVLGSPRLTCRG